MRKSLIASALSSLLLLSLGSLPGRAAPPAGPKSASGIDLSSMDKSVDPGKDFYVYANGGWLRQHPIPPQASDWSRFHELSQQTSTEVFRILAHCASEHAARGTLDQKLGDFYLSGVQVDRLDRQGIQPLKHDLDQIRAISDLKSLETVVISLHKRNIHAFFDVSSRQEGKDSSTVVGEISQSGLGLPDQDYYLRTDERSVKQRTAYQEHLVEAFHRLGYPESDCKPKADQVYALEKRLADASLTQVEMRDPLTLYHPTTQSDLAAGVASWSWPQYFEGIGLGPQGKLNVQSPKYLEALYTILDSTDVASLRSYLEWKLLDSSCDYLSEDLSTFQFNFSKQLNGAPTQRDRNSRVFSTLYAYMGMALGEKYAEKFFSAKAKAQVAEMAELLRQVLDEDINHLSWMSPETQKAAHVKLAALRFKISRPDTFGTYKGLEITPDEYLGNVWRVSAFLVAADIAKIGKPVDQGDWQMSPATVNAYYSPQMNEVVIPIAIMQPPFFSTDVDDALNYGGLGAVLGHEITHGFDDEGRKYDEHGNLRDWWAPADLAKFQALAGLVEEQYSGYTVLDGHMHLNGKLVAGESIADLGGVRLAYLAYERLLKKRPSKVLDGFTPEQRFFIGYGRLWATNTRSDYERLQVNLSKHPPGHYRVNGPISNIPEFGKAFNCPPGSPMVRETPIVLW